MIERDLLLRAILEQPDDDAARLVYADKLDEGGGARNAALAELIRVQVGRVGAPDVPRPREEVILKKWGARWLPPAARFDRAALDWRVTGDRVEFAMMSFHAHYVFERGFVGRSLLELRSAAGFRGDVLAQHVRAALAHRPARLFEFRLTGHSPALELRVSRERFWRADLTEVDGTEESPGFTLVVPDRKQLLAGLEGWLTESLDEIDFERVVEYDFGEPHPLDDIPF